MFLAKLLRTGAVVAAAVLWFQLDAAADPITYEGTLTSGVTQAGELPDGTFNDARDANYYRFWATAGDNVVVVVERVDSAMDPLERIYSGLYGSTTDPLLAGADNVFDNTATFVIAADDEIPNPGPFGDPRAAFTAPVTGWYTVAVNEWASDPVPNDGDYDYQITVRGNTGNPVPEPTMLALLACGACGVVVSRRRRRTA